MPQKEVKESLNIPDGEHTGKIVENKVVTPAGKDYEYHETHIELTDVESAKPIIMKIGLPFDISENTGLGELCKKFGATLEVGKAVNTDDYLKVGTEVKFSVKKQTTDKGKFSNILVETLRPAN